MGRSSAGMRAVLVAGILAALPCVPPAWSQEGEAAGGAQSLEQRLNALEQRVGEIEARLDDRKAGPAVTITPIAAGESPISLRLAEKRFQEADPAVGQGSDRIILVFEVKSSLEQPVRAFVGTVIFNDLFEREILRGQLTDEEGLTPGRAVTRQVWIQYQQFDEKHRRLRSIETKDLASSFVLERVIYKDGNRAAFAQAPSSGESVALRKLTAEARPSAAFPAPLAAPDVMPAPQAATAPEAAAPPIAPAAPVMEPAALAAPEPAVEAPADAPAVAADAPATESAPSE